MKKKKKIRSEFKGNKDKKPRFTRQLSYLPSLISEEEKEAWEKIQATKLENEKKEEEADKQKISEGSIISFTLSKNTSLSNVKNFFNDKVTVVWVVYEHEATTGIVLFEGKTAEELNEEINAAETKLEDDTVIKTSISTEEEVNTLTEKYLEFKKRIRERSENNRRGGKFNNKKNNHKRKAENYHKDAPSTKQEKIEESN